MGVLRWLVVSLVFLAMVTSSCGTNIDKRSPDLSSQYLQDQLQAQIRHIQTLQAEMSAMTTRVSTLEASYSTLNAHVGSSGAHSHQQVAFSAHYSQYGVVLAPDAILKFNSVPTNIGGHYSPYTGKFTAPVPGVYLFLLHIVNGDGDGKIEVDLMKSGTPIAKVIAEGSEQRFDKGSGSAAVHLSAGDTVYAVHSHLFLGGVLDGGWLCSFTGVLVTPD